MMPDTIEDVYSLSPMQKGILFHVLYADKRPVYLDQQAYELTGGLDTSAFKRAWEHLIDRHPVLRTSFHWEGLEEPLQVVHSGASLPFECHDWSSLSIEDKESAFE